MSVFIMGAVDPSLGSHACTPIPLPNELSPFPAQGMDQWIVC